MTNKYKTTRNRLKNALDKIDNGIKLVTDKFGEYAGEFEKRDLNLKTGTLSELANSIGGNYGNIGPWFKEDFGAENEERLLPKNIPSNFIYQDPTDFKMRIGEKFSYDYGKEYTNAYIEKLVISSRIKDFTYDTDNILYSKALFLPNYDFALEGYDGQNSGLMLIPTTSGIFYGTINLFDENVLQNIRFKPCINQSLKSKSDMTNFDSFISIIGRRIVENDIIYTCAIFTKRNIPSGFNHLLEKFEVSIKNRMITSIETLDMPGYADNFIEDENRVSSSIVFPFEDKMYQFYILGSNVIVYAPIDENIKNPLNSTDDCYIALDYSNLNLPSDSICTNFHQIYDEFQNIYRLFIEMTATGDQKHLLEAIKSPTGIKLINTPITYKNFDGVDINLMDSLSISGINITPKLPILEFKPMDILNRNNYTTCISKYKRRITTTSGDLLYSGDIMNYLFPPTTRVINYLDGEEGIVLIYNDRLSLVTNPTNDNADTEQLNTSFIRINIPETSTNRLLSFSLELKDIFINFDYEKYKKGIKACTIEMKPKSSNIIIRFNNEEIKFIDQGKYGISLDIYNFDTTVIPLSTIKNSINNPDGESEKIFKKLTLTERSYITKNFYGNGLYRRKNYLYIDKHMSSVKYSNITNRQNDIIAIRLDFAKNQKNDINKRFMIHNFFNYPGRKIIKIVTEVYDTDSSPRFVLYEDEQSLGRKIAKITSEGIFNIDLELNNAEIISRITRFPKINDIAVHNGELYIVGESYMSPSYFADTCIDNFTSSNTDITKINGEALTDIREYAKSRLSKVGFHINFPLIIKYNISSNQITYNSLMHEIIPFFYHTSFEAIHISKNDGNIYIGGKTFKIYDEEIVKCGYIVDLSDNSRAFLYTDRNLGTNVNHRIELTDLLDGSKHINKPAFENLFGITSLNITGYSVFRIDELFRGDIIAYLRHIKTDVEIAMPITYENNFIDDDMTYPTLINNEKNILINRLDENGVDKHLVNDVMMRDTIMRHQLTNVSIYTKTSESMVYNLVGKNNYMLFSNDYNKYIDNIKYLLFEIPINGYNHTDIGYSEMGSAFDKFDNDNKIITHIFDKYSAIGEDKINFDVLNWTKLDAEFIQTNEQQITSPDDILYLYRCGSYIGLWSPKIQYSIYIGNVERPRRNINCNTIVKNNVNKGLIPYREMLNLSKINLNNFNTPKLHEITNVFPNGVKIYEEDYVIESSYSIPVNMSTNSHHRNISVDKLLQSLLFENNKEYLKNNDYIAVRPVYLTATGEYKGDFVLI